MSGIHLSPGEKSVTPVVNAVRQIVQGRDDASGIVTLTANTTTTLVPAPNTAPTSHIILSPATAAAAAEWKNGTIYVNQSDISQGQFIITHSSSSTSGRTVFWAARG